MMSIINIFIYSTKTGKKPFIEWRDDLDSKSRAIIRTRIDRVRLGNFGDAKLLKDSEGIWELRVDYGPGYRIYFGKKGAKIVILLTGGDKSSQARDIAKAKKYWLDAKELNYE